MGSKILGWGAGGGEVPGFEEAAPLAATCRLFVSWGSVIIPCFHCCGPWSPAFCQYALNFWFPCRALHNAVVCCVPVVLLASRTLAHLFFHHSSSGFGFLLV